MDYMKVRYYFTESECVHLKKGNPLALLPVLVFLVLYLGLGITFEYVMKIPMGFYNIPIIAAFLIAILAACLQNRKLTFDQKTVIMGKGIGEKNIIIMVLIFFTAGIFSGIVGRAGAQSVAYFLLSLVPARYAVAAIFTVACFVSTAMGTSVGTITIIAPIAIEIGLTSGYSIPLCLGTVVGGAMFGDNLSFISDTTIAACNGQGCKMKDKFRENFWIALPAALISLVLIIILTSGHASAVKPGEYNLIQLVPYVLVLIGGAIGINVFLVLMVGILSGSVITLCTGAAESFYALLGNVGAGISGMYETAVVAILVAAMCALIRECGGFDALLYYITKTFKGKKCGQLGIGLLVGVLDIATANNTVAIVIANPIAKEMAVQYDVSNKKVASILDTFSCIFQGVIPYGAQMLVAISAASALGQTVTAFQIMRYLFYPGLLLISSLIFIFLIPDKKKA